MQFIGSDAATNLTMLIGLVQGCQGVAHGLAMLLGKVAKGPRTSLAMMDDHLTFRRPLVRVRGCVNGARNAIHPCPLGHTILGSCSAPVPIKRVEDVSYVNRINFPSSIEFGKLSPKRAVGVGLALSWNWPVAHS